jgi:hypothetical protein
MSEKVMKTDIQRSRYSTLYQINTRVWLTELSCHVRLPFADLGNSQWRLKDLLGDATYDWAGNDLQGRGLYLDERPWSARVFALTRG